jgi:hypothetical protein
MRPLRFRSRISFGDGEAAPDSVLTRLQHADGQPALNLQLRCKSGALIDVEVRCNRLETDGRDGLAYVTHDVSVRARRSSSSSIISSGWIAWRITIN